MSLALNLALNFFMRFLFFGLFFFSTTLLMAQPPNVVKESPFFDFDVSGSSGNYNGKTYTELHIGINMNFAEWLIWRNAAFKRISPGVEKDMTGLDSGLRFVLNTQVQEAGIKIFAGPGYRWADPSEKNAFFGEAGAGLQLGRVGASAGMRYLRYDKAQMSSGGEVTKQEDLTYFITIAGGAGLSF